MKITSKLATIALTSGLVVAGFAGTAFAASTDPTPTTANVEVSSAITLTNLTPTFTLTGIPGQTVDNVLAPVTFNVLTNNTAGYAVTVQSETATMVPAIANGDSIAIAALGVRETGTTPYSPMSSTVPVTVHSQDTRSGLTGDALSNDYQITIPNVNSDTYTATLDYVATTL